jgi:hypothetical protein
MRGLTIAILVLLAGPAAGAPPTPPTLQAEIARAGAAATVAQLTAGSGVAWHSVIAHISTGASAWLALVPALQPGTDAASGEDLTGALATALQTNPTGVLALAGPTFPLAQICADPQIEPTDAQLASWTKKTEIALSKVVDPSLAQAVAACRKALTSS